ncbi:MAG TPA: carboxypeptidase-like regulatory domain-containing protein, partial [Gemmatimonadaceae bacterium]
RRDFRLSRDSGQDGPRELGTVVGSVTGSGGGAVPGAIVSLDGARDARSDDAGQFVLHDVPAGTRQIEVQAIGAAPLVAVVDVSVSDTTRVSLALGKVQTLDAVRVSAPTFRQVMVRNIEERKRLGLGYVRDSIEIAKLPHSTAVIDGVPGVKVCRSTVGAFFLPSLGNCKSPVCPFSVWIDGAKLDAQAYTSTQPDEIAIVEVYSHAMPDEFRSRGNCGAIIAWTKHFLHT